MWIVGSHYLLPSIQIPLTVNERNDRCNNCDKTLTCLWIKYFLFLNNCDKTLTCLWIKYLLFLNHWACEFCVNAYNMVHIVWTKQGIQTWSKNRTFIVPHYFSGFDCTAWFCWQIFNKRMEYLYIVWSPFFWSYWINKLIKYFYLSLEWLIDLERLGDYYTHALCKTALYVTVIKILLILILNSRSSTQGKW